MNQSSTSIDRLTDMHMRFPFPGCTFLKLKKGNRWGERKRGSIVPPLPLAIHS